MSLAASYGTRGWGQGYYQVITGSGRGLKVEGGGGGGGEVCADAGQNERVSESES